MKRQNLKGLIAFCGPEAAILVSQEAHDSDGVLTTREFTVALPRGRVDLGAYQDLTRYATVLQFVDVLEVDTTRGRSDVHRTRRDFETGANPDFRPSRQDEVVQGLKNMVRNLSKKVNAVQRTADFAEKVRKESSDNDDPSPAVGSDDATAPVDVVDPTDREQSGSDKKSPAKDS